MQFELMPFGQFLLRFLNFVVDRFGKNSARSADKVVMVAMIVFVLKTAYAVAKIRLMGHACIVNDLHGAGDGRVSYFRVLLLDQIMQIGNGQVPFGLNEDIENAVALSAESDIFRFQVFLKGRFSGFHKANFPATNTIWM